MFVGHGIAEWLVKHLLVESSLSKDEVLKVDQVAGIIFLQPDNLYSGRADFNYKAFTEYWIDVLQRSGVYGLPDTRIGDRRDDDEKDETLPNLRQRLRWIDKRFQSFSENTYLSCHTWVLRSPLSISEGRQDTKIPVSNSSKHRSMHVTTFFSRLRRDQTAPSVGAVKENQVEGVNRFIKLLENEFSSHTSVEDSFVSEIAWAEEHLYFSNRCITRGHLQTYDEKPRHSSLADPSKQDYASPILKDEARSGLPERAPRLPPPDNYIPQRFNYDEQWQESCDQVQKYLSKGDLENADILCKRCVDTAELLYHGTDIPLQWRMRRAIITFQRGNYQEGYTELDHLIDKCYIYKEELSSDNMAWRPEPGGTLASGYQRRDLRSSRGLITPPNSPAESSSAPTRSQRVGIEENVLESLRVLNLELLYHIATISAAMGRFQHAERTISQVREHLLRNQTSVNQEGSYLLMELRELKLSVGVSRLLALLKSYRGSFVDAKTLIEDAKNGERLIEKVETTNPGPKILTKLAETKILLSQGLIQKALDLATAVLPDVENELGATHLISLEAKCLHVLLWARSSQVMKAEAMVLETSDVVTRQLGKQHPFVLDMAHTLVLVCELQYRSLHALWTSESLVARSETILGSQDQRTIRFQGQRAWIHVRIGNYKKGASLLRDTYATAKALWGPEHPWTVIYLPKLAIAYALLGLTSDSTEWFQTALLHQIVAFGITESIEWRGKSLHGLIRELLSAINTLGTRPNAHSETIGTDRSDINQHYTRDRPNPRPIHPEILSTLQLWAEAESNSTNGNRELLLEVQRTVYKAREESEDFGESHVLTLQAGLNLAKTMNENSEHGQITTEGLYDKLWRNAEKALDPKHPLVLSARLGLQTVQLVQQTSPLKSPASIAEFFLFVQKTMSLRLGIEHPDTLRASLEVFAMLKVVDRTGAEKVAGDFLSHVRSNAIWDQRPVESIKLQVQLAWLYFTQDEPQHALVILRELRNQLEAIKGKSTGNNVFEELLSEIVQAEKAVREAMGLASSPDEGGERMCED